MRRLRTLVAAVVAVGILVTALAGWLTERSLEHVRVQQISLKTENAASAVQLALDRVAVSVRAIRAIYASDQVSPDQFTRFGESLALGQSLRSIGFYRLVPASDRASFEARLSGEGGTDGIWQLGGDGKRQPAPQRLEYYVVEAAFIADGTKPAIGLDVATLPGRLASIERAIAASTLVVSNITTFNNSHERGVIFYLPVEDSEQKLIGIGTATISLKTLASVAGEASGATGIRIAVDNGSQASNGPAVDGFNQRRFGYADQDWLVTLPSIEAPEGSRWITALVVGAGLATTLAIAAYLVGLASGREANRARLRLRGMLDGLGPLAWLLAPDGSVLNGNRSAVDALGPKEGDVVGKPLWDLFPQSSDNVEQRQLRQAVQDAAAGKDSRFDIVLDGNSEAQRVFDLWLRPLGGGTAEQHAIVASAVNVTDRYEGEQAQRLLMRELDHRMKNTLQVLQSVVRRTARTQRSVPDFEKSLLGRIASMSRSHELLARERWIAADMSTILDQETASFTTAGTVRLSGPSVRLNPRAALAIGLVVHELATNAAKYGALFSPNGQISVDWQVDRSGDEPVVRLIWREIGGPAAAAPTTRGFGSMLIERSIAYELEGKTEMDYQLSGLICTITMPLRTIRPQVADIQLDASVAKRHG